MRLKDKVAIITGVGSGMGRAATLLFAREGARVVGSDVNDEAGAETVRLAKSQGGEATYTHCDVSKADEVREMVSLAVRTYGKLDILYNNAGIPGPFAPCPDVTEEEWDRTQAINLKSVFFTCKYALPELVKQPTSAIVNTASSAALGVAKGEKLHLDTYAATKGGIMAFSKWIASNHGPEGVRVNVICPGVIDTPMSTPLLENPEAAKFRLQLTPLRRFGKAEDIANLALFLASDDSSFITGAVIPIDGGIGL